MNPLVTVIIPSYNHARYLPKRIESILAQSFTDYELIIIDDCSPDDSDAVIRRYTGDSNIKYYRNPTNSGTPFSSWEKGVSMAKGKYIWICESDDFAEKDFLEKGVTALEADERNVLFYSNSNVVNENDAVIGSTADYFVEVWKTARWKTAFVADGLEELRAFQLMGQTVPNMSSALIRQTAFRQAYSKYLLRFHLTGDWLFVGLIMRYGRVVFTPEHLSNFRKHQVTSRVRVKSAQSQAEFILTKYALFQALGLPNAQLLDVLSNDAIRFIYEDASAGEVIRAMLRISAGRTFGLGMRGAFLLLRNRSYLEKFKDHKHLAEAQKEPVQEQAVFQNKKDPDETPQEKRADPTATGAPPMDFSLFSNREDYQRYKELNAARFVWQLETERQLEGSIASYQAYCSVCGKKLPFTIADGPRCVVDGASFPNYRETLSCTQCGFNSGMRGFVHILGQLLPADSQILIMEQITPLFRVLAKKYPGITGSEFLDGDVPLGQHKNDIRNEDATALTFSDGQFDAVLSFDVFEHVPDFRKAFRECARVLKPSGQIIFTAPFVNVPNTIVRAQLTEDGTVIHLLEPEYRGNPLSKDGSLCFYHFGWDVLQELKKAGFAWVGLASFWSYECGYMGMGEQMIIIAKKGAE